MTDDDLRAELKRADPAASLAPLAPEAASRLLDRAVTRSIPRTTRPAVGLRRGVLATAQVIALLAVTAAIFQFGAKTGRIPDAGATHTAATSRPDGSPSSVEASTSGKIGPIPARSPSVTRISVGSVTVAGECLVPDADQLAADARVAVEGTVSSVDDGVVTLQVDRVWAGATTDLVEVSETDGDTAPLLGDVVFQPGKTYLIAATTGGQVMTCGYSGPADPKLLALYNDAF